MDCLQRVSLENSGMEPMTFISLERPQGPLTFYHLKPNKKGDMSISVINVLLCKIKADLSVMRWQAGRSFNKWLTVMTPPVKPRPICYFAVKSHKSQSRLIYRLNGCDFQPAAVQKIRTTAERELIKSKKNQPQMSKIMTTAVLPSPNTAIPLNSSLLIEPIRTAAGQSVALSTADRRRGGAWQLCRVLTGVWQQQNWHTFRRSILFCPCQACSDLGPHVTRLPNTNRADADAELLMNGSRIYPSRTRTPTTVTGVPIVSIRYKLKGVLLQLFTSIPRMYFCHDGWADLLKAFTSLPSAFQSKYSLSSPIGYSSRSAAASSSSNQACTYRGQKVNCDTNSTARSPTNTPAEPKLESNLCNYTGIFRKPRRPDPNPNNRWGLKTTN